MDWNKEFPRASFLDLISSGLTEPEALQIINEDRGSKAFAPPVLVQLQLRDSRFKEDLAEAKRVRADKWFNDIARSANREIDKEQVPGEKLKFEQRKYLASIDNPEKYSEKVRHEHNVEVNIFAEMKGIKDSEVRKLMTVNDPFAAEFNVVTEEMGKAADKKEDSELQEMLE